MRSVSPVGRVRMGGKGGKVTCLAMVLESFGEPLKPRELEVPELEEGQVLVRLEASGVCGSDLHMALGKDPRTPLPIILGHEGVGRVERVRGIKRYVNGKPVREGDRVLWNRGVVCGKCYWCATAGQPWLCPSRWVYGIHRSIGDPPYLNGCYSQYVILDPKTDIFPLPEDVDPAVLVPASCSGATAAHAFALRAPREGEAVLVQGPGPLGLFAVAFARKYGAYPIVLVGGTEVRLEVGRKLGATHVLDRKRTTEEERREAVLDLTGGRGVDVAYEAVGRPEAVVEGLRLVRRGGSYLSMGFGVPAGSVTLDVYHDLEVKDLSLHGVWVSHTEHTRMAMELVLERQEDFSALVTNRFPLSEANRALEAVEGRGTVKAVLLPWG